MRVKVSPTGLYTYPDVVVVCDEPQFEDSELDTLLNPTDNTWVLSETNVLNDRLPLPSLSAQLFVSEAYAKVQFDEE
jgi:hypothetical protein